MRCNEDTELVQLRRRLAETEQRLAVATRALERGCALTLREREETLAAVRSPYRNVRMPSGAYC